MTELEQYFERHARPVSRYEGQLDPEFQVELAAHYGWRTEEECTFSHTVQLPDGRVQEGAWDLRGLEDAVLGYCDLAGRRVLEYGPASGWLTAHIAAHARETIALELAPGGERHIVPMFAAPSAEQQADVVEMMERFRRSWWLTRREADFQASIVYADLQAPPADLGRFDVSVFSTVLLRLPNPFMALQGAAEITDEAIVVAEPITEVVVPGDPAPVAHFAPAGPDEPGSHWWHHSPAVICRMLAVVGFPHVELSVHTQPGAGAPSLFTVVGRRAPPD
jgi:O-methyltransferase